MSTRPKKPTNPEPIKDPKTNRTVTEKQMNFVHEYLASMDAKKAAQRAGYSEQKAPIVAKAFMDPERYPLINKLIQNGLRLRREALKVDSDKIIQELACIGFLNPLDLFHKDGQPKKFLEMTRETAAAVKSINISYKEDIDEEGEFRTIKHVNMQFHDKLKALEQLAKMLGAIQELQLTQHNTQVNIIDWDKMFSKPEMIEDPIEKEILSVSSSFQENGNSNGAQ